MSALVSVAMTITAYADAEWITGSYVVPSEKDFAEHFADAPAPVLSRDFTLADKKVKRATWRIVSPGMYDASVNGKRVNSVSLPIWTAYDKRVLEDEYDVTALVKNGENQLVIRLGNGWWNPLPMGMFKGLVNLRKILPHGTPTAKATLEDAVGCDKVIIDPKAVAGITWAKGHLDTPRGRIHVSWRMEDGKLKVKKSIEKTTRR